MSLAWSSISKDEHAFQTEDELEEAVYKKRGIFKHIKIARSEWPRVLYLSGLFGVITMVHTIMGNMREMVVMGRQDPMSIFFIKSIFLPPFSIFFVWMIQIGLDRFTPSKVFDIVLMCFSGCYVVFGLGLWPLKHLIQMDLYWARDMFGDGKMESIRSHFLFPVFLALNEWTSSLLFMCSEMWGALVASYLFHMFSNEVSTGKQTQRYISVYNVSNALSIFCSAILTLVFNKWRDGVTFEVKEIGFKILVLVSAAIILGILMMKKYMEKAILPVPVFATMEIKSANVMHKRTSKKDTGSGMLSSKVLIAISLTVLFYGIASTLCDATFKNGLAASSKYGNKSRETLSNFYNGMEQLIISISLLIVVNSPYSSLIKKGGWIYVAGMPVAAAAFSLFSIFLIAFYNVGATQSGNIVFGSLFNGWTPLLAFENGMGMLSIAIFRLGKYIGSDVSKEAISMQLDPRYRAKYKAVYDGLCGKLGKSMGSIICMAMTGIWDTTDVRKMSSVSALMMVVIIGLWVVLIRFLSKKYQDATSSNKYIVVDEIK
jgi:AAA family ATP:ADP antiporter